MTKKEFEGQVTKQSRKRIINVPTKQFDNFPVHAKVKIINVEKKKGGEK